MTGVQTCALPIFYQRPAKFLAFYLRGQVDPAAIAAQVRTRIQSVDPELPVFRAETLDDVLSSSLSVRRFSMQMVAAFAATALLLAGLGIYGTISYLVNEQRREIAIRLALGAQRDTILKLVLRRGLISRRNTLLSRRLGTVGYGKSSISMRCRYQTLHAPFCLRNSMIKLGPY